MLSEKLSNQNNKVGKCGAHPTSEVWQQFCLRTLKALCYLKKLSFREQIYPHCYSGWMKESLSLLTIWVSSMVPFDYKEFLKGPSTDFWCIGISGVSYGLTQNLLKFWKRAGFVPVYIRQTPNDLTGEYSCIMLKTLHQGEVRNVLLLQVIGAV